MYSFAEKETEEFKEIQDHLVNLVSKDLLESLYVTK